MIEDDLRTLQEKQGTQQEGEVDRDDPDDLAPRVEEEPVSSDDESFNELSGRQLRSRKPRTVRFEPEYYYKKRRK